MSDTSRRTLNGHCLCGAVQFSATGSFHATSACHCSQCAHWTGTVFVATIVKKANLNFIKSETLKWFRSSEKSRRGFCAKCGSSLFWKQIDADHIDILAGSLDQPTGLKINDHIFVSGKSDYYQITDTLPQYTEFRTSE